MLLEDLSPLEPLLLLMFRLNLTNLKFRLNQMFLKNLMYQKNLKFHSNLKSLMNH